MMEESKRYLEKLKKEAKEFLTFLYKKFGIEDFTCSDVKKEIIRIPYYERQQKFGCYNERQLSRLFNKSKILERRPFIVRGKRRVYKYNLKKEVVKEIEDLIKSEEE